MCFLLKTRSKPVTAQWGVRWCVIKIEQLSVICWKWRLSPSEACWASPQYNEQKCGLGPWVCCVMWLLMQESSKTFWSTENQYQDFTFLLIIIQGSLTTRSLAWEHVCWNIKRFLLDVWCEWGWAEVTQLQFSTAMTAQLWQYDGDRICPHTDRQTYKHLTKASKPRLC